MSVTNHWDDEASIAGNCEAGRRKWQRRSFRLEKFLRAALPHVPASPLAEEIRRAIDFPWDQESDGPIEHEGVMP